MPNRISASGRLSRAALLGSLLVVFVFSAKVVGQTDLPTLEGDFVVQSFHFMSGEVLPELRLHYSTLGAPTRGADACVNNALMVLHRTGGDGHSFLRPQFSGELFGPGQLLDLTRYYKILPDGIGHGKSPKPSDGAHARFPAYGYADMVAASTRC